MVTNSRRKNLVFLSDSLKTFSIERGDQIAVEFYELAEKWLDT